MYQQAIVIDGKFDARLDLARHRLNLSDTYRHLRQWKDCGAALDEGLALARTNGDRYWEGTGLKYYGWAFRDDKQPAKAREYLTDALKILREIGAKGDAADVEQVLAKIGG